MDVYTLAGVFLIVASLICGKGEFEKITIDQSDDSFGYSTLTKFYQRAGLAKTIGIYGGVFLGTTIALLPSVLDAIRAS